MPLKLHQPLHYKLDLLPHQAPIPLLQVPILLPQALIPHDQQTQLNLPLIAPLMLIISSEDHLETKILMEPSLKTTELPLHQDLEMINSNNSKLMVKHPVPKKDLEVAAMTRTKVVWSSLTQITKTMLKVLPEEMHLSLNAWVET